VLGLPLIADGGPIGSLLIYSDEWEAFDEKETELLQQAANDVAQGIVLLRARIARLSAEEALKKTEAELTRVARVTTMGELTASIAHEINQPLAALVTNANACLRWLAAETPNLDEARATAQRIVRDGKRASEVIARIRALLGKGQPMRQRLNINDVILEILPLLQAELLRRETKLERQTPARVASSTRRWTPSLTAGALEIGKRSWPCSQMILSSNFPPAHNADATPARRGKTASPNGPKTIPPPATASPKARSTCGSTAKTGSSFATAAPENSEVSLTPGCTPFSCEPKAEKSLNFANTSANCRVRLSA